MKTNVIFTILFLLASSFTFGQVAINTDNTTANASAMLDVKSTDKGLLIPRMTTVQRTAISSPADGLLVYDETTNSFWFYDSGNLGWTELITNAGASDLNDLSDVIHIGENLYIGGNNGNLGNNVSVGGNAMEDIQASGDMNNALGGYALNSLTTGDQNNALGYGALYNNVTGSMNTAIGDRAGLGFSGTSFSGCVMIGNDAGMDNTADNKLYIDNSNTPTPLIGGNFSTDQVDINGTIKITGGSPGAGKVLTSDAIGLASWTTIATGATELDELSDGTTDSRSVFLGSNAGANDDGNNYNTAVGIDALNNTSNGERNIAMGYASGNANTSGADNILLGYGAGYYNSTGSQNVSIGSNAGRSSSGNSYNGCVLIGYQAGKDNTSDNKLFIDNSDTPTPLIGGDFSTNQVDIYGTIKITGGSPGAGKVLTSDAIGLASWTTIATGATELDELSDGTTDSRSVFLGSNAGTNDDGNNYNTAVGIYALHNTTSGQRNIGFGYASGNGNTSGVDNILLGYGAGYYNSTGSQNVSIGSNAGRSSSGNSYNGCVLIGYQAGKDNTSDNKLFIDNSSTSTPLIGGDFSTNELYFNTSEVGIGTNSPNEELEVAGLSGNQARMIVSDGMGSDREVLLFVSPNSTYNYARIEAYKYGTGSGGRTLKINTTGNGNVEIGGNVLPESHKAKDLGASGTAWDDVYADDFVNQGAAAFADTMVTKQLLLFPPQEKKEGAFDEFTDQGAKELDPASLPASLTQENGILIDEMTTYNYKANFEQQQQIEQLKAENEALKERLERLENLVNQANN